MRPNAQDIKALIESAGEEFQPSPELRSNFLDSIDQRESERSIQRKLTQLLVVTAAVIVSAIPLSQFLGQLLDLPQPQSEADIQRQISLRAENSSLNHDWSMVDVYSQLRESQAESLRHAFDRNRP